MTGGAFSFPHRGQALIEAAFALPLLILFILGILQLTLIEHARIMTQYAAFQAARAAIVFNADPRKMRDAAVWSLLPTRGRTDSWRSLSETFQEAQSEDLKSEVKDPASRLQLGFKTALPLNKDFDSIGMEVGESEISVDLRNWYEMRIPFANMVIFYSWLAAQGSREAGSNPFSAKASQSNRYFLPLTGNFTLKMQSKLRDSADQRQ